MIKYLLISLLLQYTQSCKKELGKIPSTKGGYASVKFYTDYSYVAGVDVFIKSWEVAKYDTAFTKLIFREIEPFCNDISFKSFKAAKGRYYSVQYFDKDAAYIVDTAFMVPEYNEDTCVFINLNN